MAGAGEHLERDDVVGRAAVAERPRPARVVADHPADRASVVGGRIGAEAQTVRCRGALELDLHDPRLHPRSPGLRVDGEHPVQVTREVDDDAGSDGVAAREVPVPREVRGTPSRRHTSRVVAMSSIDRARTTACGGTR